MRRRIPYLTAAIVLGAAAFGLTLAFEGNPSRNTVWPNVIDDVLYNPGMGFATHNAFDGDLPGHPKSTIGDWGWYWKEIEPEDGVYRWDKIDAVIEESRARGQRIYIGLMPTNGAGGIPDWYRATGAAGWEYTPETPEPPGAKQWMPDHNDPRYLKYYGRLIREFGARYDGHPDIDHVTIRSLGHWGEWHFAFVEPRPTVKPEIRKALVDIYFDSFKRTKLTMLIGGRDELAYAVGRGAGWMAECLGDLGFWGPDWNHMKDSYQQSLDYAKSNDAWKNGPVIFESCGVMETWHDKGYDVDYILNDALRWHCSIFGNKNSPVTPRWWNATEEFMKRMGYRLVVRYLTHPIQAKAGETIKLETEWENLGVAPPYRNYEIAFELRPMPYRRLEMERAARTTAQTDLTRWLPGSYRVDIDWALPADMKPGKYHLALALLDPVTKRPAVELAIEGVDARKWYALSALEIVE